MPDANVVEWIRCKYGALIDELDERGRRRWAATEAASLGWGGVAAVSPLLAGLLALVAFVLWERRAIRRHGQALLDLSLFRSPSFTWGTILVTTVTFSMFGLIFSNSTSLIRWLKRLSVPSSWTSP